MKEVDDQGILHVGCVNRISPPPIKVYPHINGVEVCMELDTGAAVSIISIDHFRRIPGAVLLPCETTLTTYTSGRVRVVGEAKVYVKINNYCGTLPVIVTDSTNVSLFGRDWLAEVPLNWVNIAKSIKNVSCYCGSELSCILNDYKEVFAGETGLFKGVKVKIKLKENVSPKFFKARPVPYALKEKVTEKLNNLVRNGVIEPVNYSEWASQVVIVPKPNNIRLCADFKVTINKHLEVDSYPLPKPVDIFASLNGGTLFSKLDLSRAYEQLEVDEKCRDLLTINTHQGLFLISDYLMGWLQPWPCFRWKWRNCWQAFRGSWFI